MANPRTHTATHLISALPAVLGFEPSDAIVVVGLTSAHRTGVVVRLDRSDCLVGEMVGALGRSVAVHLMRAGLRQACIVSYREGPLDVPDPALEAMVEQLAGLVTVRDAWLVAQGRFRSQWCEDFACCPRRGTPVSRAAATTALGSRSTQVDDARRSTAGRAGAESRRRAMRARDRALAARDRMGPRWDSERFSEWRAAVDEALDGRLPSDAASGRLLAALDVVAVRDAIVVDLDGVEEDACGEVLAGRADARVKDSLWGLVEGRPARDGARVEAAVDVALHLASLGAGARSGLNAAPMTIAAIGHWWLGDAASARHLADAALAAQPDYRLAQLVGATLLAGIRPR